MEHSRGVREVRLEFLRPGPSHNQLLSPLTPYVVLCGDDGPCTVHVPFEHGQLMTRLERLRYSTDGVDIADAQREAEVRELGADIARLLGNIPSFASALGHFAGRANDCIHLRLCFAGAELGLIPFEAALAPPGVTGHGEALFTRSLPPITVTREVRRLQPLAALWDRPPRILFAFASPDGVAPVPAAGHLHALRTAIEPWVDRHTDPGHRAEAVKKILTVLPHASLADLRKQCASGDYTHVHILAHGAPTRHAGFERYGVVFEHDNGSSEGQVVLGNELAIVLMGLSSASRDKRGPTLVSLATCDSGAQGSVMAPAGNIAHELHDAGVPWVIASQFPLWMSASCIAANVLYAGLLAGYDPRRVLHELRQRLRTDARQTHDWASIVAYVSINGSFDEDVEKFRTRQTKARIEVLFRRIDELIKRISISTGNGMPGESGGEDSIWSSELGDCRAEIQAAMREWLAELPAHDPCDERDAREYREERAERAERLGMSGSSSKRIAIAWEQIAKKDVVAQALDDYKDAAAFYRRAMEAEPTNHWTMTQMLSLYAVIALREEKSPEKLRENMGEYRDLWAAARTIARLHHAHSAGKTHAWACGTLLELELLGLVIDSDLRADSDGMEDRLKTLCNELVAATGYDDLFPIDSTLRQFERYMTIWECELWAAPAKLIVDTLKSARRR